MVLKRTFLSDTGEDSYHWFRSQGDRASSNPPGNTEICAVLLGETTLSQYNSFSGKMVLKWLFLSDTGEDLAHLFWGVKTSSLSLRRQSIKSFSKETEVEVDTIVSAQDSLEKAISQ